MSALRAEGRRGSYGHPCSPELQPPASSCSWAVGCKACMLECQARWPCKAHVYAVWFRPLWPARAMRAVCCCLRGDSVWRARLVLDCCTQVKACSGIQALWKMGGSCLAASRPPTCVPGMVSLLRNVGRARAHSLPCVLRGDPLGLSHPGMVMC